jgi:hypothetical protein
MRVRISTARGSERLHVGPRSLPLALLIQRAFQYTQLQTDLLLLRRPTAHLSVLLASLSKLTSVALESLLTIQPLELIEQSGNCLSLLIAKSQRSTVAHGVFEKHQPGGQ